MANLPSLPPHIANPPTYYVQPPVPPDHQPLSWIEMGLMRHAIPLNMMIDGQKTVLVLQNLYYLAQLVSEGMQLAIRNYINHV